MYCTYSNDSTYGILYGGGYNVIFNLDTVLLRMVPGRFEPPVTVIMLSPGVTGASPRNRRFAPLGF